DTVVRILCRLFPVPRSNGLYLVGLRVHDFLEGVTPKHGLVGLRTPLVPDVLTVEVEGLLEAGERESQSGVALKHDAMSAEDETRTADEEHTGYCVQLGQVETDAAVDDEAV